MRPLQDSKMNDEFENALLWFSAAPNRWIESAKKDLAAAAEWLWEVLQGDFNDDQSTAQVVTGTVISMIPFVDQICDVRDICANSKKIHSDSNNGTHWVSLVLTLVGLFPVLGSLFKGCAKVMFTSLKRVAKHSGTTKVVEGFADLAIAQLNKFLARPEVVKTLKLLKMDNVYKRLAIKIRTVSTGLNKTKVLKAFDEGIEAANSLLMIVNKWGTKGLGARAMGLLNLLKEVRNKADSKIAEALKPVKDILEQLARRLDIEADMAHRVTLNAVNPHAFNKVSVATEEAAFLNAKPAWVDKRRRLQHRSIPRAIAPPDERWTSTAYDPMRGRHPLDNAHETFSTLKAITIPPGTKLYRVIDPKSSDNSICWMSEAEFMALKSKSDWRRKFAVWANWNSNGEFVTYIVPSGRPLHVWEGVTASQKMGATSFVLEGGARQIVIDPAHLIKSHMGVRQPTNWGYDDLGVTNTLVGVPVLKNNWYEKK